MPTTLGNRVEAGFSAPEAEEFAAKYLDTVIANLRDMAAALRRATLLLVLTIVAFFVVDEAKTTVTLGPFKLEQAGPLIALLPVVAAHLFYEVWNQFLAMARYRHLLEEFVKRRYPTVHENHLVFGLMPTTSTLLHRSPWFTPHHDARPAGRVGLVFDLISTLTIVLGGYGFLIFAMSTLLEGNPSTLDKISVAFIGFTILRTFLLIDAGDDDPPAAEEEPGVSSESALAAEPQGRQSS